MNLRAYTYLTVITVLFSTAQPGHAYIFRAENEGANYMPFPGPNLRVCFDSAEHARAYQEQVFLGAEADAAHFEHIVKIEAEPLARIRAQGKNIIPYGGMATPIEHQVNRSGRDLVSTLMGIDVSPIRDELLDYVERVAKRIQFGLPGLSEMLITSPQRMFQFRPTRQNGFVYSVNLFQRHIPHYSPMLPIIDRSNRLCVITPGASILFSRLNLQLISDNFLAKIWESNPIDRLERLIFSGQPPRCSPQPVRNTDLQISRTSSIIDGRLFAHPALSPVDRAAFSMHLGLLRAIGFDDLARAQSCNNVVLNFRSYEKINDILATVFTDENTLYKTLADKLIDANIFDRWSRQYLDVETGDFRTRDVSEEFTTHNRKGVSEFFFSSLDIAADLFNRQFSTVGISTITDGHINSARRALESALNRAGIRYQDAFAPYANPTTVQEMSLLIGLYYASSRNLRSMPESFYEDLEASTRLLADYLAEQVLNTAHHTTGFTQSEYLRFITGLGLARPDTIDLFKKAMRGFMSRLNQVEIAARISNRTLSFNVDREQRICHTTAMECMNSILSQIDRDYASDSVKPMEYFENGIDSTPNAMIRNDAVSNTFTFVNFSSIISSGSASLRSRTDDFASGEFPEEYIQQGRNRSGRTRPRR